jgi:hypothetical protein
VNTEISKIRRAARQNSRAKCDLKGNLLYPWVTSVFYSQYPRDLPSACQVFFKVRPFSVAP